MQIPKAIELRTSWFIGFWYVNAKIKAFIFSKSLLLMPGMHAIYQLSHAADTDVFYVRKPKKVIDYQGINRKLQVKNDKLQVVSYR